MVFLQELYELAVELIKRDHAYVCHQKSEELKGHNPLPSPWRNRPIQESLTLFEVSCFPPRSFPNIWEASSSDCLASVRTCAKGKSTKAEQRCAWRRLWRMASRIPSPTASSSPRTTAQATNGASTQPMTTRIAYATLWRTSLIRCAPRSSRPGLTPLPLSSLPSAHWRHLSSRRRSSYYWLCNVLDLYCPVQWEYGRLNLSYTVVSKRKIGKLISEGIVRDWDDPRLFTLSALRRRGFPPEAINMFCGKVGVTMSQVVLDPALLEACVRDVLNVTAPRWAQSSGSALSYSGIFISLFKGFLAWNIRS